MKYKPLTIGDLTAKIPIIQGGMGIGVSMSSLAGAVAKEGAIGVISAAQPGFNEDDFSSNFFEANRRALKKEIKKAKEISNGGIIGVNLMVAVHDNEGLAKASIEAGADIIISGAGLPLDLPKYVEGSSIKIAPIVSSQKAAKIILDRWDRKNAKTADLIVIEGPKAGGHLGFKAEEAVSLDNIDSEILKIIEFKKIYEEKYNKNIPVVFGGGVYFKEDMQHYIELGCDGVQMATRFVATEECDADIKFKEAYINAKEEDIVIVKSPVGMPGRAILNKFIKERLISNEKVKKCYKCIKKCDPATTPYCITKALYNAVKGNLDEALIFCGANASKIDKITTVKEIISEMTS